MDREHFKEKLTQLYRQEQSRLNLSTRNDWWFRKLLKHIDNTWPTLNSYEQYWIESYYKELRAILFCSIKDDLEADLPKEVKTPPSDEYFNTFFTKVAHGK